MRGKFIPSAGSFLLGGNKAARALAVPVPPPSPGIKAAPLSGSSSHCSYPPVFNPLFLVPGGSSTPVLSLVLWSLLLLRFPSPAAVALAAVRGTPRGVTARP